MEEKLKMAIDCKNSILKVLEENDDNLKDINNIRKSTNRYNQQLPKNISYKKRNNKIVGYQVQ